LIDEFHDYTHTPELKATIRNEDFRNLIRKIADICQSLKNLTSNSLPFGIYSFDKPKLVRELREITEYAINLREAE